MAYADAIDASVVCIDGVIDTLASPPRRGRPALYAGDGNNLYDDARSLVASAFSSSLCRRHEARGLAAIPVNFVGVLYNA